MANNSVCLACVTCDKELVLFTKLGVWRSAYQYYHKGELDVFLLDHMAHDVRLQTDYEDEPYIPMKV